MRRKKPGPKARPEQRRRKFINVALTDDEKKRLDARRGLIPAAVWLRDKGLNA